MHRLKMLPRPSFGLRENACSPISRLRGSHTSIPKNANRKKLNMNVISLRPWRPLYPSRTSSTRALDTSVINVCRNANELDIEKTLFKEVDHDLLREQIVKSAPELASERKKLSDEESACRTTTIHLDGLDRDAIVHLVTKAMRGIGASECEIEGFKDDIKNADHDTMLAKAINWGAPVNFLKDGQPWVAGDWRRLSLWQRAKRRFSLLGGGSYYPDGTIELASQARERTASMAPDTSLATSIQTSPARRPFRNSLTTAPYEGLVSKQTSFHAAKA